MENSSIRNMIDNLDFKDCNILIEPPILEELNTFYKTNEKSIKEFSLSDIDWYLEQKKNSY